MKKIAVFLGILFLTFEVFSQVKFDNLKMKKLGKNEYLDYIYLKDGAEHDLKIFKTDEEGNPIEDLIFLDFNGKATNVQISEDKKKILFAGDYFFLEGKPHFSYDKYYLIDGNKGTIKYVFTTHTHVRTSKDFKYFLSIADYSPEKGYEINVQKVSDGQIKKTFYWKTGEKSYGGIDFFRSEDFNYDFRIIYIGEYSMYGEAFYRVNDNTLHEVFNDTFDEKEYINDIHISDYEGGAVSHPGEKTKNENWDK